MENPFSITELSYCFKKVSVSLLPVSSLHLVYIMVCSTRPYQLSVPVSCAVNGDKILLIVR